MESISIYDLLTEVSEYTPVTKEKLDEAAASDIDNDNHVIFSGLVEAWRAGFYDEDPDLLAQRIIALM